MHNIVALLFLASVPGLPPDRGCGPTDSLTVRNAHAMAYHDSLDAILVFGGADERRVLADLWSWDGSDWRCIASGGPPPRTFPSLAYDKARNRLLLFGGNRVLFGTEQDTSTFLDDTWIWDDRGWQQQAVAGPSARAEAAMIYDEARERIVLFGGYRNEGDKRIRLGDTWEWDGRQWVQRTADGPTARNGAAIAYDPNRERTVLFGGSGNAGDTWEWDGVEWRHIPSADTTSRFNAAMTYDGTRKTVVRFGGWTRAGRVGDTWQFNGVKWTKLADEGPPARNHAGLVYDDRRDVVVLFGGHDGERVFGDVWEWNGSSWFVKKETGPRLRVENGH